MAEHALCDPPRIIRLVSLARRSSTRLRAFKETFPAPEHHMLDAMIRARFGPAAEAEEDREVEGYHFH